MTITSKARTIISMVIFIIAITASIDTNNLADQISVLAIIIGCIGFYLFKSYSISIQQKLLRAKSLALIISCISTIVLTLIFASSTIFKLIVTQYFALSLTSYLIYIIRTTKLQSTEISDIPTNDIKLWYIVSVILFMTAYNLFESQLPYFKYGFTRKYWIHGAILLCFIYYFVVSNTTQKTGYVSSILSLLGYGMIYYNCIPASWFVYTFYCSTGIGAIGVLIFIYYIFVDLFSLRNALNVLLIMFMAKGVILCYHLPEIQNSLRITGI
ncbi:MAG: hypothetical protein K2M98_07635 [Muribaculum sp.]|nr:hypothetical protein [Muribaculum sp.]